MRMECYEHRRSWPHSWGGPHLLNLFRILGRFAYFQMPVRAKAPLALFEDRQSQ